MKVKHILILYLIGFLISIIGAQLKIMHWVGGSALLAISSLVKTIAVLLGIWKVFTIDRFKEFLNS
ncbi:MAG: hypothetical protein JXB49_32870 [Bacteroidales bacterium]|nr:hypothetical protein [Bacteroidales bacterium]